MKRKNMFESFDTHALVEQFIATGFDKKQAEALVSAIKESRDYDLSNLATKKDIFELKSDILKLEASTKEDIHSLKQDITRLETAMKYLATKEEVAQVKNDIVKWIIGLQITTIGTVFAMLKYFIQ